MKTIVNKKYLQAFIDRPVKDKKYTTPQILSAGLILTKEFKAIGKQPLYNLIRKGHIKSSIVPGKHNSVAYLIKGSDISDFLKDQFNHLL